MEKESNNIPKALPTPQLLDVKLISDGWIKKYLLHYRLPNGTEIDYESISRKDLEGYRNELLRTESTTCADAISIVGRTSDDEIVLVKEFRYPLNSWCIAFPAGLMEADENIFDCAQRELQEETGYSIISVDGIPDIQALAQPGYSSTGMSEESVQIVYALVEKTGKPKTEPIEFIEVFTLKITEIPAFIRTNKIPIGTRSQLILESFNHSFHWNK